MRIAHQYNRFRRLYTTQLAEQNRTMGSALASAKCHDDMAPTISAIVPWCEKRSANTKRQINMQTSQGAGNVEQIHRIQLTVDIRRDAVGDTTQAFLLLFSWESQSVMDSIQLNQVVDDMRI